MARLRLIWQLFPAFLLILLASMLVVTWVVTGLVAEFHEREARSSLEDRLSLMRLPLGEALRQGGAALADARCKALARQAFTRFTLIGRDGAVLADSAELPAAMENHGHRPEVRTALAGGIGYARRQSATLRQDMAYVAVPLTPGDPASPVLRAALPVTTLDRYVKRIYRGAALAGLAVLVVAAALSLLLARRMTRPLRRMLAQTDRFAAGDLDGRLRLRHSLEMDALAEGLNRMAGQLDERLRTVSRQHNELNAILASMTEGVIAVDAGYRIMKLNAAAARMLEIQEGEAQGRTLLDVIRNLALQEMAMSALASPDGCEGDVTLHQDTGDRYLQARGAMLRDAGGNRIGAVVVLNDVTRLRRLENLRREFVANVSHELRTPITSIHGFVETLQDGALEDPVAARRFLEIIAGQAERLGAIIEDLLLLSKAERDAELGALAPEWCGVAGLVQTAVQTCAHKQEEKRITVTIDCPEGLQVRAQPNLLRQVVVNLLENALTYSPAGGTVVIAAASDAAGRVHLRVRDHGCGIAPEHHARIFERFYRVDKARSRESGGTGLGLAIVKHIMQAHGGQVTVDSTPGQGSTFTVTLPPAGAAVLP